MSEIDLKQFSLFADFEAAEIEALEEVLESLHLEAGAPLFQEGERGEGLLLVAEGGVQVRSSREPEAVTLPPGASLGAFSLVESGPREAEAETTSRSHILVLRRSAFGRLRETDPHTACRLLEAILRETVRLSREALEVRAEVGVRSTHSDVDPRYSDD